MKLNSEQKMRPQADVVLVQTETAGAKMTDQEDDTMLGSQEKV